jgi:hypothetical protein
VIRNRESESVGVLEVWFAPTIFPAIPEPGDFDDGVAAGG